MGYKVKTVSKYSLLLLVVVLLCACAVAYAADKVTVCHVVPPQGEIELEVNSNALAAHLAHGDYEGACTGGTPTATSTPGPSFTPTLEPPFTPATATPEPPITPATSTPVG